MSVFRQCFQFAALTLAAGLAVAHDAAPARPQASTTPAQWVPSPLRVAINHGNAVLARIDPQTGQLSGVSVDIALELGRSLGVDVRLVGFDAADKSVEAVRQGVADVGFFAIDPQRGQGLKFTAPYVIIEGAYAVPAGSAIRSPDEVDRAGHRVVVAARSAYDLYLGRALKQAQLVKTTRSNEVVDSLFANRYEVAAGVKQQLEADLQRHPDLRILQPSFMEIRQAMAAAESRTELNDHLRPFVERLKRSGFVREALQRHGVEGAAVAPAMPGP